MNHESSRLSLAQTILEASDGDVIWVRSPEELRIITIKIEPEDKEVKGRPQDFVPYVMIFDDLEAMKP